MVRPTGSLDRPDLAARGDALLWRKPTMPINLSALSTAHQVPSLREREAKAAFRRWQAVFYTVRDLLWKASRSAIFKDAIADGSIQPIEPGYKDTKSGKWIGAIYDPEEVKALYSNAWENFQCEFDKAFAGATLDELVGFAESRFGTSLDELLKLNRERSAERFNRAD